MRRLIKWLRWVFRPADRGRFKVRTTLRKFARDITLLSPEEAAREEPYEVISREGNLLLNEGINELWTILCSAGGTKFDNTNAYIGVGDGTDAAAAGQTGLLGANKTYKAMDGGYPTYGTDQKATWRATFGAAEGNHAWEEWTVANGGSDAAKNLNRKVEALGTKTTGSWQFTVEISLS